MNLTIVRIVSVVLCLQVVAVTASLGQGSPTVLIVYYSATGNTQAMANAVADGARSVEGVKVLLRTVDEATQGEILEAQAIIIGSPVYSASVAPQVQSFINSWPFENGPMKDKIGAAFCTAGGISAGEELVQLSILHSMLIFGMIVVGGPEWTEPFGASAVTEEAPFHPRDTAAPQAAFLKKGAALGERVAKLAKSLYNAR